MIVKLVPSVDREEGWALIVVDDWFTIVIVWTDEPKDPIDPVTPPIVA